VRAACLLRVLCGQLLLLPFDLPIPAFVVRRFLAQVGEGEGKMVAVAVGMHSQFGILKSSLTKPRERTALQEKLGKVADGP